MELKNRVQDLESQLRITQVSTSPVSIQTMCMLSLETRLLGDKTSLDYQLCDGANNTLGSVI